MTEEERRIRQKLKDDFIHYASKCLKIRTKSGAVEPFTLNKAQLHVHHKLEEQKKATGKVRALCLKGRQQGISTYIGGRFYHQVTHRQGCQAFILTHALDATQNLYKMAQRYYENTPEPVKPQVTTSNSKELIFGLLDSGYKLGTAENKAVGRSATIQLLHGSEAAFWNHAAEHAKGILQAVPNENNTEIIFESTANGQGNFFHQQWQKAESGESEYQAIFVPWFWQNEYVIAVDEDFQATAEEFEIMQQYLLQPSQILWRRQKIADLSVNGTDGEKNFHQEYPLCPQQAFVLSGNNGFIEPDIVVNARKAKGVSEYGKLIIGVDPARFGDDRTAIILRKGRKAYDLKTYSKKDTMEVTGLVHVLIRDLKPDIVNIDVGGLGAGIVDRLHEMGYKGLVKGINSGSKPLDARYYNKRAEMWGLMKEWLLDEPVQIPDSDELHADLCNTQYKFDSNTRLLMERKEDMKSRGIRSSDTADALALTFGTTILSNSTTNTDIAASLMSNMNELITLQGSYD